MLGGLGVSEVRNDETKIQVEQGKLVPFVTKDEVDNKFLSFENKIDNKFNELKEEIRGMFKEFDNKLTEIDKKFIDLDKRFSVFERDFTLLKNVIYGTAFGVFVTLCKSINLLEWIKSLI
jgi:archaellum component FlaC